MRERRKFLVKREARCEREEAVVMWVSVRVNRRNPWNLRSSEEEAENKDSEDMG